MRKRKFVEKLDDYIIVVTNFPPVYNGNTLAVSEVRQ